MAHPFKHFKTITKHRHTVMKLCFKAGLYYQGLTHDLSKYSPAEFIPGAKYYQGTRSPNDAQREEYGYSSAWLHHKGRNRHHFEYWNDYYRKGRGIAPVKMPRKYVVEMFCDRIAACKIYMGKNYTDKEPLNYFERTCRNHFINTETANELGALLRILAVKGEDEAFKTCKVYLKGGSVL